MGVRIDNVRYEDVYRKINETILGRGYICVTDVGNVVAATRDKELFAAINESLLSIPDGMPLVWYAKLSGLRRIGRIPGFRLMERLLTERDGLKHYLLGDTDHRIHKVIGKAKAMNSSLVISGYSPPFKPYFGEEDNRVMLDRINNKSPDIVWVSFGGGKQEKWMHENVHRLEKGILIGAGAAFKFYIGEIPMPPKRFQDLGFQWFLRMMHEPGRWARKQFSRYIPFLVHFPWEVAKARSKTMKHIKASTVLK